MIATQNTVYDGQVYKKGEEIWDLGSFKAYASDGNRRDYSGLSKDVSKLPHYVTNQSTAFCADTGDAYVFNEEADMWYLQ